MSAYPAYQDFGKSTKDFFSKGFQVGKYKLNVKSNPSKDINATMQGTHDLENGEASGEFSAKCTCPHIPGMTSVTKWTTANVITQELIATDKLANGLEVSLEGNFNADSSSIGGKLRSMYKHRLFTIDGVAEGGDSSNPLVGGSVVTGHKDFAAGYQFEVDANEGSLKKNNVSLAYVKGPVSFLAALDNAELFWSGLVYRHNPEIELGITGTYKSDPEGYGVVGAAMKYMLDCCNAIKAKFDSDMQVYLGYETKIRPTATITASAQIDGNKINEGGHKIGLSFDLEC